MKKKHKLNLKGRISQAITGEEPWYYDRMLLKDNSQFVKGNVIDVSCGKGKHKNIILGLPDVETYTGLDWYVGADIQANLNEKLPIKDNKYDTAICFAVLDYLKEPQIALKEIFRILKPNSYLLLKASWVYSRHSEATDRDYFRFSDKGLEYMLDKAGFKIEHISSLGGMPLAIFGLLRNWLTFLEKTRPLIDKMLSLSGRAEKNTLAYFVIAKKL